MSNEAIYPLRIATKDYLLFEKHYLLARSTKDLFSIEYVFFQIEPNLVSFSKELLSSDYTSITMSSFYNLLESDSKTPSAFKVLQTVSIYLKANDLTWYDLLVDSFLSHLNKEPKYLPKYFNKDRYLFFFIASEIKYFLFKKVRTIYFYCNRNIVFSDSKLKEYSYLQQAFYEDCIIDLNYLEYLLLTDADFATIYYKYLFTNKKIKKEDLCQLTKILL